MRMSISKLFSRRMDSEHWSRQRQQRDSVMAVSGDNVVLSQWGIVSSQQRVLAYIDIIEH